MVARQAERAIGYVVGDGRAAIGHVAERRERRVPVPPRADLFTLQRVDRRLMNELWRMKRV